MSAAIPPELEEFVDQELAKGRYRTRDEVIFDGLRLLRKRKLYELRREIDAGLEQIERGELTAIESRAIAPK